MIILDPGHYYALDVLDKDPEFKESYELLKFVKREGEGYPGNIGHHSGTNMQEVMRALIDRLKYLNKQIPCEENENAQNHLREAIWELEYRAAKRHNRPFIYGINEIENHPTCPKCLHIGCKGKCHL